MRLGGAGADEATDKASVMSAYGTTRWRKLRASFRRDCELRQLPCGICRQAGGYAAGTQPNFSQVPVINRSNAMTCGFIAIPTQLSAA